MTPDIGRAVEAELAELAGLLTEPGETECLRCYLLRMTSEFGCDGTHRWTARWRDQRAPTATGLTAWLRRSPGCGCDCGVLATAFPAYPAGGRLPCAGQPRPGSAAPCRLRRPG